MAIYILPHIIENAAKLQPDKVAFKYLNQTITFSELETKSNQLAHYLVDQNVQKGDRIGIYMPRCLETTIAVYGILKAGAVYVPLDPFSPINRTEFVIKDCGIQHIVSIPQQARKIKKFEGNLGLISLVGIEKEISNVTTISWEQIFNLSIKNYTSVNVLGDDLAYILYTSGSTGVPKGIMHTHKSALAFVTLAADLYEMQGAIYGMHAPLHFDPSVQGYFAAPYTLATTVIISDAHTKMPASLAELIEKEKITIWFSVPLALIQMLNQGGLEKRDMSSLKWVLFSGEVFATKHLRNLMNCWSFAKFSNIYGPTETNQCTYYHLENPPKTDLPIPIGFAWGNTEFKILNDKGKEVAFGEQGELVVRTATMMKGYWNNPALTQNSLYKETQVAGVEKIYYRTGDQVKQDKEGKLLFFGRNDNQIKLRGYRIELGEIENVVITHPQIREAVALVILNTKTDEKELFVIIIVSNDEVIKIENIKQFCQKKLPVYAVPDQFKIVDEFPRTASEKINRKQLELIISS